MSTAISNWSELATSKHVPLDELGRNYLARGLLSVLFHLENLYCWLPGAAPIKVNFLAQTTLWPREDELEQLHSVVIDLYMTEHKRLPNPDRKAYRWVDKLFPKLRLVGIVDHLVTRARNRSQEAGESYLMRLKREEHEGSLESHQLLKNMRVLEKGASKAATIKWENYEQLLFSRANKPAQLVCDGLSASPRMRCYARTLEIIAEDHLRYERMYPLLRWIAYIGYPDFPKVLGDTFSVTLCKQRGMIAYWRKKERTRLRVAKFWLRKRARMSES